MTVSPILPVVTPAAGRGGASPGAMRSGARDAFADLLDTTTPADPPFVPGSPAHDAGADGPVAVEPPLVPASPAHDAGDDASESSTEKPDVTGVETTVVPLSVVTTLGAAALQAFSPLRVAPPEPIGQPVTQPPVVTGRAVLDAATATLADPTSRAAAPATPAAVPESAPTVAPAEGAAAAPSELVEAPADAGSPTAEAPVNQAEAAGASTSNVDRATPEARATDDTATDDRATDQVRTAPGTATAQEVAGRQPRHAEHGIDHVAPPTEGQRPSADAAASVTGLRVHDGGSNAGAGAGRDGRPQDGSGQRTEALASAAVGATTSTGTTYAAKESGHGSPAAITGQVFPEVARLVTRGDGMRRLTVKLNPEALGEVRVVLTVRNGDVHVRMTGSQAAHQALLNGVSELHRLLDRAGASSSQIVVGDGSSSGGQSTDRGASHEPQRDPSSFLGAQDGAAGRHDTNHRTAGTRDGSTTSARDGDDGGTRPRSSTHPGTGIAGVARARTPGVDVTM